MPATTINASEAAKAVEQFDSGAMRYPGDTALDKPETYYNPTHLNLRFKVYESDDPTGQERFQFERFAKGRYTAYTTYQRDAVRRVLRQHADRYRGEDSKRDLICANKACAFRTRNVEAYEDHKRIEELKAATWVPPYAQ